MSSVYTYSEARQKLALLLEEAATEGRVRIKRRDGRIFVIQPEERTASPFDVPGIDLGLNAEEIVEFVHEGRRIDNSGPTQR